MGIKQSYAPCKDCNSRVLGCHSVCEEYIKWNVEQVKFKQDIKRKKRLENESKSFLIETTIKGKRRKNGK